MKKHRGLKLAVVLAALAILAALVLLIIVPAYKVYFPGKEDADGYFAYLEDEYPEVTFDEESGIVYVNNELIVMVEAGTTDMSVHELARDFNASVVNSMPEYGIYQLQFEKAMSLDEMDIIIAEITDFYFVEEAYINPVLDIEEDEMPASGDMDTDIGSASAVQPVYPNDGWNGAAWNMDVPSGENWGMEAVHAPQAWAYRDQLSVVNIGLIDSMVNIDHPDLDITAMLTLRDLDSGSINSGVVTNKQLTAADHGCHVAGIMGAAWNDGDGVSGGTANQANLFYSACYDTRAGKITDMGYYTAYRYVAAIDTLLDNDVQAINISQNTSRLIGFAASHGNTNAINHLQSAANLSDAMLSRIIVSRRSEGKPDFVICIAAGNSNSLNYYPDSSKTYGYRDSGMSWETPQSGGSLALYNNFLALTDNSDVMGRIIVVGSVGIDSRNSTTTRTRFRYSTFSCVGARVDICAPGENIYSCYASGYGDMSGTSMATPHVTAAAGMVFAANPELTGPEVKAIILASTYGRFNYTGGNSGMLDMGLCVENALLTVDESVSRVVRTPGGGLDICFVVDTTGSMEDDIDNARQNMSDVISAISAKTSNYRVAIVDYRDFADRTGEPLDYSARVQLNFTGDNEAIVDGINGLTLGNGGDTEETVYSGLITALGLDWRPNAHKIVIVLGDAEPLDPEPYTGYTYDYVSAALFNAVIFLDGEYSDERVLGDSADSLVNVYSIGTEASGSAEEFFRNISEDTGGTYTGIYDAELVSEAIVDSIDQIDVVPVYDASIDFKAGYAGEEVEVYRDGEYLFSYTLDENGDYELASLEVGSYEWKIPALKAEGSMTVAEGGAQVSESKSPWYQFAIVIWRRHTVGVVLIAAGCVAGGVLAGMLISLLKKQARKRKLERMPVKCPSCGGDVPRTSRFCTGCGHDMTAPVKPEPAAEKADAINEQFCANCGSPLRQGGKFCRICGAPVPKPEPERVCPGCGRKPQAHEKFCRGCGTKIE